MSTRDACRRLAALALAAGLALNLAACKDDAAAEIQAGRAALDKKDAAAARIHLKNALQEDPNSPEARYLLGRALLEGGDPRGASVELMRAMDARWNDKLVLPALARAMLLSGQVKKLTDLYGEYALDDPTANAEVKSVMASAWGILGDSARFDAAVKAAIASKPDLPAVQIVQARMAINGGRLDDALALLDRALERDPASYEGWFLKGQLLTHAKNDPKAGEAAYRKTLEVEPAYVPAHAAIVGIHLRAFDVAGAKQQAAALRKVLPKHPHSVFLDAQIALIDNDLPRARELTQALLKWAPDNPGVLQLAGTVEGQLGATVLAETYYAKALQVNPGLTLARRNLARLYVQQGQPQRALRFVEPLAGPNSSDAEALSIAGDALLQMGDARQAEQHYARAVKLRPDEPRYRTAGALFQLTRGDADAAFSRLEAIAAESNDTSADMAIVSARLKRRELDAALKAMDGLIAKQPKNASLQELRGRILAQRRDADGARAAFDKALQLDPKFFAATLSLARLDLAASKPADARTRLKAAVDADPRNTHARVAYAEVLEKTGASLDEVRTVLDAGARAAATDPSVRIALVDVLSRKKQVTEALAVAQEAVAAFPRDAEALDTLGRTQILAGDTQQAISTFHTLASVEPTSVRAHMRSAEAFTKAGNREGALASLRRALEIDPNHLPAQAALVDRLLVDGRAKDALEFARAMQARQPDAPAGYLLEGAIHVRGKDWAAATAIHRKGLERVPGRSELGVALLNSLAGGGQTAEADKFAAAWMQEHPADAEFGYRAALQQLSRGRLAEAETAFTRLATQRPDDPMVLNNLAWLLVTRGKPGALPYAERAVELAPNHAGVLDTLALALAADKQFPKAIATQRKALEIAPGDATLRLNLAKIALQAGDKPLARSELDRLSALGAKSPVADEVGRLQKAL